MIPVELVAGKDLAARQSTIKTYVVSPIVSDPNILEHIEQRIALWMYGQRATGTKIAINGTCI